MKRYHYKLGKLQNKINKIISFTNGDKIKNQHILARNNIKYQINILNPKRSLITYRKMKLNKLIKSAIEKQSYDLYGMTKRHIIELLNKGCYFSDNNTFWIFDEIKYIKRFPISRKKQQDWFNILNNFNKENDILLFEWD